MIPHGFGDRRRPHRLRQEYDGLAAFLDGSTRLAARTSITTKNPIRVFAPAENGGWVNQRQIGPRKVLQRTHWWRERDPDVILVGEIRDLNTIARRSRQPDRE